MRRSTALWLVLNLGLTGGVLAGCAAMVPGYTPVLPGKSDSKLKAQQTGGGETLPAEAVEVAKSLQLVNLVCDAATDRPFFIGAEYLFRSRRSCIPVWRKT